MNSTIIPLEEGYTAEFDTVDRDEWYKVINQFLDTNIYQTWSYDAIRCGEKNISHLVLRRERNIIAAAQVRIMRMPILSLGAAYILWGPLWRLGDQFEEPDVFRFVLRALRNEYVCRRGMILRIFPLLYDDNVDFYHNLLLEEGYIPAPVKNQSRTLILDIRPPIDDLRKKLDQKWRNCLNRAERNNLELIEGTEDSLFADFIGIYGELLHRKKFQEPNDINEFRIIQRDLPPELKMRIFLCRSDGIISAGAIFTAIGNTGVYLFGATSDQGMANKGSYLIQWKAIQWMKNSGCQYYNLNGINPILNPGTYHFKSGISGKSGKDVYYLGRFDCYSSKINASLADAADLLLPRMKKIISFFGPHVRSKPSK
jgi:lipid II:glycine glycyltransferase (peptidoglycan interpeptide bridge formation enzyme)